MMLESIEALRRAAEKGKKNSAGRSCSCFGLFMSVMESADAIESEVAERFMELPVDADGEVIHIGDTLLKSTGAPQASYEEVVAVSGDSVWFDCKNGGYESNWANLTRHRCKSTVEDVMHDYAVAFMECDGQDTGELDAEYAGKLREAVRAE